MSYDAFASQRATAQRLIAKFGQPIVLTKTVAGGYDAATGSVTPETVSSYSNAGTVVDYRDTQVDGSVIMRGDKRVLMPPFRSGAVPSPGDTLAVGQTSYRVVNVETLAPSGLAVTHTLQVRA